MHPIFLLLAFGNFAYWAWLRNHCAHWNYYPGYWHHRSKFFVAPIVMFKDDKQETHTLRVSIFAIYQEAPLKLVVSPDGRQGHVVGSERAFLVIGSVILISQLFLLFSGG